MADCLFPLYETVSMKIEWQCLDCGDNDTGTMRSLNDEQEWNELLGMHNLRNPGCDGGLDALRARELRDYDDHHLPQTQQ